MKLLVIMESQPIGNGNPAIFAREVGPISRVYQHGVHDLYFDQDIGPIYDNVISRRLYTAEYGSRTQLTPCELCGGKKWQYDRFLSEFLELPS